MNLATNYHLIHLTIKLLIVSERLCTLRSLHVKLSNVKDMFLRDISILGETFSSIPDFLNSPKFKLSHVDIHDTKLNCKKKTALYTVDIGYFILRGGLFFRRLIYFDNQYIKIYTESKKNLRALQNKVHETCFVV